MAERSTAAVDVADDGEDSPVAKADQVMTDGDNTREQAQRCGPEADTVIADTVDTGGPSEPGAPADTGRAGEVEDGDVPAESGAPELHSGHKLAARYRLEECVTRLDGFSSWRAVDEKLRRAVGVHLLPANHPRARTVLSAARSSALLGDPRFVQVLDAVEEGDHVYVVHEWLPDATELTALLAAGPLEAHDAYQLVSQISTAMTAAHREGLSHLRLTPSAVLRTSTGQYRIRGLAVNAALRGITSDTPQRTDTEAIGALLYASLTQRWPYEEDAYGLSGLPKDIGLIPPDQVRAGVHRGLSELSMRALANDGATASRQEPACTSPEELARAVAAMPRVRKPEPVFTAPPEYQHTSYQQGSYGRPQAHAGSIQAARNDQPPAPLQGRSGRILKWGVAALLIAALGLGSWQLADAVLDRGDSADDRGNTQQMTNDDPGGNAPDPVAKPFSISTAREFVVRGGQQNPDAVGNTYDRDPSSYWRSKSFVDGPSLVAYKGGVGIVYDLGENRDVSGASIGLRYAGDRTTGTLYAADSLTPSASVDAMKRIATGTTKDTRLALKSKKPVDTRYVLLWLTDVPNAPADQFSDAGYKQAITDVKFTG